MRLACLLATAILAAHPDAGTAQPERRGFDVEHYAAEIRPDIQARAVTGRVTIRVRVVDAPLATLTFDRGDLTIDRVVVAGTEPRLELPDGRLVVQLSTPAGPGQRVELEVAYHGAPSHGLVFAPARTQVYTIFSTGQWLVCVDEPDDKATLDLRVTVPRALLVVASGVPVGRAPGPDETVIHHWRQAQPVSSFTMAFAAGRFTEAAASHGPTTLRFLGDGFTADQLTRAFADTADMLAFFAERAGVPYPLDAYSQVLVANTAGQEASGFAMLSEVYGRRLLADPAEGLLSAHELAHQWWGVLVTCVDWRHFWLNEGMATFMAAAYAEHRFGRPAYDHEVASWRASLDRVRREGGDKPLVFPDWNRPSRNDRTLVYDKGALVFHLLRERVGEAAFWAAIRTFTRSQAGRSVTTRDLELAFGPAAGDIFATWVAPSRP